MDTETHIYCENLVETLCGEKNEKTHLSSGYFFGKTSAMFWNNTQQAFQINEEPLRARYHGIPPMGKLPELGEGNNYITVPDRYGRTSIHLMCNDCLAIMRLRELE